jgi:hypothetical protein
VRGSCEGLSWQCISHKAKDPESRAAFAQSSATFARLYPCFERENKSFAGENAVFPIGTLVAYISSG